MFFSSHIKILLHIYCLLLTHTHSLNYSDPESNSADVLAEVNDSLLNNTLSDYNEEKNNSESIHKILEDFEKTLDNNKKIYDLDHVDTAVDVIEDSVITDGNKQEDTSTDTSKVSDESVKEEATDNSTKTRLACNNTEPVNGSSPHVFLVNATQYQAYLHEEHNVSVANRSQPGTCSITMFFAPWCEFSAGAAPHYNALARVFPQLRSNFNDCKNQNLIIFYRLYAVDSSEHHSLNTQYGVMAVPSIFVFHNSRPLYKYNYTEYNLSSFTQFVSLLTGH